MRIKLFADTANIDEMTTLYHAGLVRGFTTNPTLMRRAGVTDYPKWAHRVLTAIPDLPVSFEVLSDDPPEMLYEGRVIGGWGRNVYVKIPIVTTKGATTRPVISDLLAEGIKVNVTGICDPDYVDESLFAMLSVNPTPTIISVFAGRIADTGRDPIPHMKGLADYIHNHSSAWNVELLWASTRQVYSILEAEKAGCDIITVTPDLLRKVGWLGRKLTQMTLDTIRQLTEDAHAAGYNLEGPTLTPTTPTT